MVRRSSLIFAASLAVLSAFEPTLGFAAAAPAQHHNEAEKPRFLRREVKRAFLNTTTSLGAGGYRGPYGGESTSDLKSLTESLISPSPETTEAAPETTTTAVQTSSSEAGNPQSTQPEVSPSSTVGEVSQTQSQPPSSTSVPPLTSTSVSSPDVTASTSAAPPTSSSVNSNTVGAESISTQTTAPVASNTETSATIAPSETRSSETGENSGPTSSRPAESQTPVSQSTKPSDSGSSAETSPIQTFVPPVVESTTGSSEQTTARSSQPVDTSTQALPSNTLSSSGNGGIIESLPGSSSPATKETPATESMSGPQTLPSVSLPSVSISSPVTESASAQLPPTSESQPTSTGVTARTLSSVTPPGQTTNARQPGETPSSTAEQTAPSVTTSSAPQDSNTNTREQTHVTVGVPGSSQSSASQEQFPSTGKTSIPDVVPTSQQPFTLPGQSQTSQEAGSVTQATSPSKGSDTSPVVNTIVPSITSGVVPTSGVGLNSNSASEIGNTIPNGETSPSIVATMGSSTEASANTNTQQTEILPSISTSGGISLGLNPSQSLTNGAQPASSPSLPESVLVLPTATESKPVITSGAGETSLPVQQGSSIPGVVSQASVSSAVNPLTSGVVEGSTLTGTELYSALTNALSATVGPGSSMLPNGAIVPTAISSEGGLTAVSLSGQQSGASAILSVPSVTLSAGSVVANPLASSPISELTGAPSITLPGGSIIANPLTSISVATTLPEVSGVASFTPGGSLTSIPEIIPTTVPDHSVFTSNGVVISTPLASIPSSGVIPVSSSGADTTLVPVVPASITLPDSSVIQNPSATNLPSGVSLETGQSPSGTSAVSPVLSNPTLSETGAGSGSTNVAPSDSQGVTNSLGVPVSNSAQRSGAPQASATDSSGSIIPLPVQSSLPVNSGVTNTETAPSSIPASIGSSATGPATLSNGAVVSATATSPVSGTIPSGVTSPVVVGSATNSNGESVPITAGQVTGSSTLSGGAVIPLTASNPSAATAGPASGVLSSSGGISGSSTLSNGIIVPVAHQNGSPTPTGSLGQETGSSGETGVGQTATSQNTASPATGATGGSQSVSQPAPAPVTGTATAPPNIVGSSPAQVVSATESQNFPSDGKGPFTQQPTSYDSNTVQSVPTSILAQPSSTSASQSSFSGPTGLPTGVPLVLYPPNGNVKRPDNTDLVQVGFLYPLNYDFVWQNPQSQQQIFKYLPMGIAWGLQIDIENVTMQSLRAWDTTQDLHYITTLALAWVPTGQVDSLGLLVHTPTSRFYHTPDNSTNTLLSMINIALPIAADNSTDGGDSTSFGAVPTSTGTMKDGGAPVGGGIGSTNPVRASSVGIACGVAAGAAAYGAAMFLVARRYRKKRQSHLRSPSMFSSPVMSHVGPDAGAGAALMSGGVGDHRSPSPYHDDDARGPSRGSGRSASTGRQQISAPVMAENSLGWN